MKRFRIALFWVLFLSFAFVSSANAVTITLWSGQKTYTNWSDVINIDGSKFSEVKADDVVRFVIKTSNNAQLQVSYGTGWINFDGLSSLSITGTYEMVVTNTMVSQLKQGIHVKGINYTLSAVELVSGNEPYVTECETLFGWEKLLVSGATKGETSSVGIKAYGGTGWYWREGIDFTQYRNLDIQFQQPLSSPLILQLLYGESGILGVTISAGRENYILSFSSNHKDVYSLNFISERPQNISLGSVNLIDKQGNIVTSGIKNVDFNTGNDAFDETMIVKRQYYNAAGQRMDCPQPGLNILYMELKDGRVVTRKYILQ